VRDRDMELKPFESVGFDAVIIGGGFFGCNLAFFLNKKFERVLVIEMEDDILGRASYANQARVHNGYHYPRSILTALRSRVNFPQFVQDYSDCIVHDFDQYYAIGRNFSKVSAKQYRIFMERIGAEISSAPEQIRELANPALVDEIFKVKEYAFDAIKLKAHVKENFEKWGVEVWLKTKVTQVKGAPDGRIIVYYEAQGEKQNSGSVTASRVFNCTYSHINQLLRDSQIPVIPLKHEITEMALLEPPEELRGIGITIMCGPFFSFMPFPPLGLHSLSHVRYTPHCHWIDSDAEYRDTYQYLDGYCKSSQVIRMLKDAQRYIPLLGKSRYVDSLWEVKTVLPQSEVDDSRPIMIKRNHGLPGLTCILGGKIDNIYDVLAELEGEIH